jgi:hypothetical protein
MVHVAKPIFYGLSKNRNFSAEELNLDQTSSVSPNKILQLQIVSNLKEIFGWKSKNLKHFPSQNQMKDMINR